jgi:hypothetical protein
MLGNVSTELDINNGKVTDVGDVGTLKLPIRVVTVWGISRRAFDSIRYIVGGIGFLLALPLLAEIIKRRHDKSENENSKPGEVT